MTGESDSPQRERMVVVFDFGSTNSNDICVVGLSNGPQTSRFYITSYIARIQHRQSDHNNHYLFLNLTKKLDKQVLFLFFLAQPTIYLLAVTVIDEFRMGNVTQSRPKLKYSNSSSVSQDVIVLTSIYLRRPLRQQIQQAGCFSPPAPWVQAAVQSSH